jgi:hypothetical protein
MAEFIVKLDGIKLDTAAEKKMNNEVQAAVLRVLAEIDVAPTYGVRIPRRPEWLGIWIRGQRFFNEVELKQKFEVQIK